jgi:Transglycosylase SLT domain/D-alanyl-D-alanine carboxypeptidase/Putative Flp pilus-assembly TadE/G-like
VRRRDAAAGQASVLIVGGLAGVLLVALILGAVERAVARQSAAQRAADLAALAGARAMHGNYMRLFEPPVIDGRPNPAHLEKPAYLALGRAAAERVARANDAGDAIVTFPDAGTMAPIRVRVVVADHVTIRRGRARRAVTVKAHAQAELAPPAGAALPAGGGYSGPFAYRQGKPMRPDVALAFDRLDGAARRAGIELLIVSAYRSDAEQAELFGRHPDPRWVAPPGRSLHRYGTELDLGPQSAYGWLAAAASRFHFIRRYAWEPWHFGYSLNPRSTPRPPGGADEPLEPGSRASGRGAVPGFVPPQYAPLLRRAAQRWNVSAALLAAQLYAESGFNPFAHSRAGAQGIAQFMPGTARAYGLANPFDAAQAIDAQAHLMRDLLRQFASVPLALAAYNAGAGAVAACGCIPANGETPAYVAHIIGLMTGAGEPITAGPAGGLIVRLVK